MLENLTGSGREAKKKRLKPFARANEDSSKLELCGLPNKKLYSAFAYYLIMWFDTYDFFNTPKKRKKNMMSYVDEVMMY